MDSGERTKVFNEGHAAGVSKGDIQGWRKGRESGLVEATAKILFSALRIPLDTPACKKRNYPYTPCVALRDGHCLVYEKKLGRVRGKRAGIDQYQKYGACKTVCRALRAAQRPNPKSVDTILRRLQEFSEALGKAGFDFLSTLEFTRPVAITQLEVLP